MVATFLVVGATGNTGVGTVETLSKLIQTSAHLSGHRILALTRSASSDVARRLAGLPSVEVEEQAWSEITTEWLRERSVSRAFIASHNEPTQFAEETLLLLNLRDAGAEYVVRISTTSANVRPDCRAFYPRAHWAVEKVLESPEFAPLAWSSLQPNVFSPFYMLFAAQFVNHFRRTGEQAPLKLMAHADAPVAVVDPYDVGRFAATLLALAPDDVRAHTGKRYVVNGPSDISGRQIVKLVEDEIGEKVRDVRFCNCDFLEGFEAFKGYSPNLVAQTVKATDVLWRGEASAATTSEEVKRLAPPEISPELAFRRHLEGS